MAVPKSTRRSSHPRAGAADTLETLLADFLAARLQAGGAPLRICVALSGGRDSVVLLALLCRLRERFAYSLSALHVHHSISPQADSWAAFCDDLCLRCELPLRVVRVQVPRDTGEGLEAAARRQRHAVFSDCSEDWLVLGHHRDDQAETVLLNLMRGAGVAGAAGMLAERPQARGPILLRPLLDAPRALIERYAAEHGLSWVEDESNEDRHFRRNFLRHAILPRLETQFPGAQASLARAAGHFSEGARLLDELAQLDLAATRLPSGQVGLSAFNALAPARARNLLRFLWVAAGFRAPDTRWVDEALRQLSCADAEAETCVSTADGQLHVYRGQLYVIAPPIPAPAAAVRWAGEKEVAWAGGTVRFLPTCGAGIPQGALSEASVTLCPRQGGERLQPNGRRPRRSLRNLLQEHAIPPWERQRLPFLWVDGRLAWVGGLGVDANFACAPEEPGILPVWVGELP